MKRITSMMWAAVTVFGLYSPSFTHAGNPFGGFGSSGGMSHGHFGGSNSSGNSGNSSSMKSMPRSGGMSGQVFKMPVSNPTGGKFGGKLGPIVQVPGNKFPGKIGPVLDPGKNGGINPFPGGKPPILDPGKNGGINPFPGGKPPILDPGNGGGKPPKKPPFDPFPGGKPPVLDPGNGGGKPPKKPPFDPFPGGGIPPVLDPGGGKPPGGGMPPGGGNNPPGGGNGGGNGNGNGNGNGHHHGGGKYCWPNYCLNWWWPSYYTQPYCGTVYLNGGWTYVTQPVPVQQISLVQVGETLPEIPSNATFKMQASGLGSMKGLAAVEINGVGMQAELLEWNADSVVVRLPAVGLTQPAVSQLHILQPDGSMAKTLKFRMLPAIDAAVASAN
jgi:hypothetical protein